MILRLHTVVEQIKPNLAAGFAELRRLSARFKSNVSGSRGPESYGERREIDGLFRRTSGNGRSISENVGKLSVYLGERREMVGLSRRTSGNCRSISENVGKLSACLGERREIVGLLGERQKIVGLSRRTSGNCRSISEYVESF